MSRANNEIKIIPYALVKWLCAKYEACQKKYVEGYTFNVGSILFFINYSTYAIKRFEIELDVITYKILCF